MEEVLKKYKAITIEIIDDVKRGDYEKIRPLFSNREMILQELKNTDFDREDFKKVLEQEKIIETDEKLKKLLEERKKQVVMQMNNSSSANRAAVNYSKGEKNIDINILNESI